MKAQRKEILTLLKTASGQVGGLIKMVEDDRYCIDISIQVLAAVSVLKKVNSKLLTAHLKSCVLNSDETEKERRIEEIADIVRKLSG